MRNDSSCEDVDDRSSFSPVPPVIQDQFERHVSQFQYSVSDGKGNDEEKTLMRASARLKGRKRTLSQSPDSIESSRNSASPKRRRASDSENAVRGRKSNQTDSAPAHRPLSSTIPSNLQDTLQPGLMLVLIGLNPGLRTAELGHPYAHPSNSFWKELHTSGITPVRHRPQDHRLLPELYGIGNTNICARPSRQGSDLKPAELLEGARILDEKMARYRPEVACMSGMGVWKAVWRYKMAEANEKIQSRTTTTTTTNKKKKKGRKTAMPKFDQDAFRYGWQDEKFWLGRTVDESTGEVTWAGSRTYVVPSTSGLNAGMRPADKEAAWKPLGDWVIRRRRERNDDDGPE